MTETFNINPDNLQYRRKNLLTGNETIKRLESCLTQEEVIKRTKEDLPLMRTDLAKMVAHWNNYAQTGWKYEIV